MNPLREEVLCALAAFTLYLEKDPPPDTPKKAPFLRLTEEPEEFSVTAFPEFKPLENVEPSVKTQPTLLLETSENEHSRGLRRKSSRVKAIETRRLNKELEQSITSANILFSRRSHGPVSKTTNGKLLELWRTMQRSTTDWLMEIYEEKPLERVKFRSFFLNATNVIRKTVNGANPRPPEVHELILRFIVDFNKLYELAMLRDIHEVCGAPCKLLECIISHYLHSSTRMSECNLAWVQTRETIRQLFQAMNRADTLVGAMSLMGKTRVYFISKWSASQLHRPFFSYAFAELNNLDARLAQRLERIDNPRL